MSLGRLTKLVSLPEGQQKQQQHSDVSATNCRHCCIVAHPPLHVLLMQFSNRIIIADNSTKLITTSRVGDGVFYRCSHSTSAANETWSAIRSPDGSGSSFVSLNPETR